MIFVRFLGFMGLFGGSGAIAIGIRCVLLLLDACCWGSVHQFCCRGA